MRRPIARRTTAGAPAASSPGMVGWASGWRIPSASVCSDETMSATSATGAAGTPARVKASCQWLVSRSWRRSERMATSVSRFRTRSGFVRNRASSTSSGSVDDLADRGEQPVVAPGDHELAVLRGEHLVRSDHREHRSLSRRDRAVREIADEVVADVAEGGLVEGRVHGCAHARLLSSQQRGEDPERRPHPGPHVDERCAHAHAGSSRLTGHADEASGGLHQCVVSGLGT